MKIVRSKEVEWSEGINKGKFFQRKKALAAAGSTLGCSLWELPPGKKSFPFHMHHVTEEAMYVVSGFAKVRTPEGETAIGPGDFLQFVAGSAAHQLINDGSEPLVYLGLSATKGVDIVEYPDSGKVASVVGTWPNVQRFIFKKADGAQYFDGESDAEG
ncbi:MAG: cupin domain-containing protein [Myxococcaceae bacterium]